MPERLKETVDNVAAVATAIVATIGGIWAAIRSRRASRAEVERQEAEATAATAAARREAERLEHEAYAQGFGGLKELVDYFHRIVKELRTDNDVLRARVADLEDKARNLEAAHRNCEVETARLREELAAIKERAV